MFTKKSVMYCIRRHCSVHNTVHIYQVEENLYCSLNNKKLTGHLLGRQWRFQMALCDWIGLDSIGRRARYLHQHNLLGVKLK
jgi:hypothetical protein